jgi:hypothetical protein
MKEEANKSKIETGQLGWLFALPLALVVLTHGLIHLMYVTYDPEATGLGFDGESFLPSSVTGPVVMISISLVVTCYSAAALGLIRFPVLKGHVPSLIIAGSIASMVGFVVMLPGLVPDLAAHMFGPITSLALAIGCVYRKEIANGVARVLPRFLSERMGVAA